jgi:hypothetical protein
MKILKLRSTFATIKSHHRGSIAFLTEEVNELEDISYIKGSEE